ncbi:thioester-containing protein 1 allele R1-like isoform X4 [Culex pipiens pallens]|uniref:thioester-containing protein 1 allele R1-like isoform X4 n=1 Tax=Culex pipiens pallens TaxID=42434 RepID=UPI0022AA4B6D|nr:thioester-containing protein 1 allele R1-like isoform X4 [Culex pipiens pallens]
MSRTGVTYDSYKQDEFGSIEASRSKSNHQLKVTYDKKHYNIRPDQTVKFELSYPRKIKELLYIFVSRGRIIDSGYIGSHTSNFKYRLTKRMAPKAKLVVMYLKDYLIYDALDLVFDEFDNKFDFTLDPSPKNAYMPGQEISVEFEAASDSYVALHAIDQSILQLSQTDHLFTRDDLIKELSRYDATDENAFDPFHTMGLFLKTTLKIDSPYGEDKLLRFGLMSEKRFEQPIHIRTEFPETWLWSNYSMQGNRKREITAYMPDTLTSWTITGFALSPSTGLSIIKQPLVAKVSHDFFIVANLPYSIKRDEVVVIQATVFNNLGTGLSVDVKLYSKSDEIKFYNDTLTSSHFKKKTVFVENNSGQSVSFFIKANKLGEILVRLEAVAMFHSDSVEHVLRVIPESLVHRENEVRFIDLSHETVNYTILVDIPRKADNGSVGIEFALDPSFLGTTNENLDKLLLLPTGCCEQSMVKFIPDIVILDYLDAIRATNEGIKERAINFLKQGYQNQLKCKLNNGSFAIFPRASDKSAEGSVFLTAFIAKSLKIASKHITVDGHIVADAFRWLASQQRSDGKFIDEKNIYMGEMQGGIRKTSFALTAYVLAAFLETEDIGQQYPHVVNKSTEYLKSNFDNMDHPYDLAVTSYAMSMSKDSKGPEFLKKLIDNSTFDRSNTYRYWNHETLGVEIASYALLAKLNDRSQLIDSTPIMRWLNSQRSNKGGFVGTQETFVALKALAKFAVEANPNRNEYGVQVRGGDPNKILKTFRVQRDKINVIKFDVESSERSVFVEVSGIGTGYFQVFYKYHRSILHEKESFNLAVNVLKSTTYDHLHLKVCVAFKPKDSTSVSNMALVEIALPSGIMATENPVEDLSERKDIKKTELRYEGTSIVVYYMNLSVMEKCFNVNAERRYKVAMHRPSYVVAYDYYHKKRVAIKTYEGNVKQPCELCEGEDCDIFSC